MGGDSKNGRRNNFGAVGDPGSGWSAADEEEIRRLVRSLGSRRESLLPLLQAIQHRYRYLPEEALRLMCRITEITPSQVEGVVGFYERFRRKPAGRHSIRVCIGTACHVKGADVVFSAFRRQLGLAEDQDTDGEGVFTVEKAACLGCCMLAPAVQIDDTIYGFMTSQRVPLVLKDFLQSAAGLDMREKERPEPGAEKGEVRICLCSSCRAGGSGKVFQAFQEEIRSGRYRVRLRSVGCSGVSFEAPLVEVAASGGRRFRYGRVVDGEVPRILDRHFRSGRFRYRTGIRLAQILEGLEQVSAAAFIGPPAPEKEQEPAGGAVVRYSENVRETGVSAFLDKQVHLVLEHAGELDPLDLGDYREKGGFRGLSRCVQGLSPEEVIREIAESGLRGRGGGGFPVARKWETVLRSAADERYVVCNGDEGDPGAFMDRMLLESFPFRVIEGLLIAAYAVKAADCYVYIRGEYPLALQRMGQAAEICRAEGCLGLAEREIRVHIVEGAGAFVCGEETALIAALEGRRGMPRVRPPYPSEVGFRGKPTLVNNVETFAMVPWILREGSGALCRYGTPESRGTKAFALAGKIRHGGLIEIPMGTSLNTIVYDIGGGLEEGRTFKAVQIGGPSGGCIPAELGETPVDYEAFRKLGAMMGSGGLVVLDDSDCMVDIARYFVSFTQKESCGKCTFCRVGTKRLVEILDRFCAGKAEADDLARLEELSGLIQQGSLCGLGKTSVNPVLTTLRYFRQEYEAHISGRCPAGKCKALIRYEVGEECIGCTRCAQNCPVEAIQANPHRRHEIDPEICIRCDTCRQICPVDAVRIV